MKLIITLTFLLLLGCSYQTNPTLLYAPIETPQFQKWEKYGAVFLYDETFIEQTLNGQNPISSKIINQKIKFLTKEGLQYATLNFSGVEFDTKVDIILRDSNENQIPLNLKDLKKQLRKTGKVAVPNVEVGSSLEVMVKYSMRRPQANVEYWFNRAIPVLHSKFTFSNHEEFYYNIKEYGGLPEAVLTPSDEHPEVLYHTWEAFNVLPANVVKPISWDNSQLPHVGIVISSFKVGRYNDSWAQLAIQYENELMGKEFFRSESDLKNIVDSIQRENLSEKDLAAAILKYTQDNITLKNKPVGKIDLDEILEAKSASFWEMAALLRRMYDYAEFRSEIVVTRPKINGGFDPDFIAPYQLSIPLVTVEVEGRRYLCFPFMRGARLGEFPIWFEDLSGLYLKGSVDSLPANIIQGNSTDIYQRLDLDDLEGGVSWDLSLTGYKSLYYRTFRLSNSKEEWVEKIQEFVGSISKRNSLQGKINTDTKLVNDEKLQLKFQVKNEDLVVERKGEKWVGVGILFNQFYESLSSQSKRKIQEVTKDAWEESIVVQNVKQTDEVVFACEEMNNYFVQVNCSEVLQEDELVLKRKVLFHPGNFSTLQIQEIGKFVETLNKIRESYITQK